MKEMDGLFRLRATFGVKLEKDGGWSVGVVDLNSILLAAGLQPWPAT